jgi:peptidoglycan hydrolase CwlO-like protein
MDIFGRKTQNLLSKAQVLLSQAQDEMAKDIQELKDKQETTEQRLARLEKQQDESAHKINSLQQSLDEIRDSAIRGEVASGQKTKDVATKFGLTAARISQIAPRRRYNNG